MYDLLTFGEILLRFSPTGDKRVMDADNFACHVGGAELNVAAGVSQLGGSCGIISKIPAHALGAMVRRKVRAYGISDEYLRPDSRSRARMGLYYYEKGSSPRKPEVIYDRHNSSFSRISLNELPVRLWKNARVFHTSGINPALGERMRKVTTEMIRRFHGQGVLVSFDVNFRENLWEEKDARLYAETILPMVDIFFCTEETARLTFGKKGDLKKMMKSFADEYDISYVCSSRRTVHSTSDHSFTSCLFEKSSGRFYEEKPYEHIAVVDRIGSGDAFVSGVLYGLIQYSDDPGMAVKYGNAMEVMKNTMGGDLCKVLPGEVRDLIAEHEEDGYISEMNR